MKRRREIVEVTSLSQENKWTDIDDQVEIPSTSIASRLVKLKGKQNLKVALEERFISEKELPWTDLQNDSDILAQSGSLLESKDSQWKQKMQSGRIDIIRETDLNAADPSSEAISFVKFDNPTNSIAIVGSYDKYFKIFNVDGSKNEKILRTRIQDFALSGADFLRTSQTTSQEVILCGRRPHFFSYDIVSGNFSKYRISPANKSVMLNKVIVSREGSKFALPSDNGYVHIMDGKHKTWMFDLKMNAPSTCVQFLNENSILSADNEAEVYIWDIRVSSRCLHKFSHDDGTATRSLTVHLHNGVSDDSNRLSYDFAIGAESGVVSLFRGSQERSESSHEKLKSFMSLRTAASLSAFHPSGNVLAMASPEMKNQLKLVHVPSQSVFTNWPTDKTPLHIVSAIEFSPDGAYLAVGNHRGRVLLYRLKQFSR